MQGLEYEKGFIDFSNKPDWLFDVNEKGTVPVLKEGDDWYSSSDDICEYLGKTFPEPDLGDIKLPVGEGFMGAFVNYLTDCKEMQRDPEKEKALKDEFQKIEDWLGSHEGDYFGGCSLNAVDCALVRPLPAVFTARCASTAAPPLLHCSTLCAVLLGKSCFG